MLLHTFRPQYMTSKSFVGTMISIRYVNNLGQDINAVVKGLGAGSISFYAPIKIFTFLRSH